MTRQHATIEIPSAQDAVLDEVVRRVVEACHPDRIYLFGSVARGEAGLDSDYDIYVVVPNADDREVWQAVWRSLAGLEFRKDLVVVGRKHFEERLHLNASLPATVAREGILLYRSAHERVPAEIIPMKLEYGTREWMIKARKDLRAIELLLGDSPPDLDNALFHSEQAAEKALKAFLYWHDAFFRKTHNLGELAQQCSAIDRSLSSFPDRLAAMTEFAVETRYPYSRNATREETDRAAALAWETYEAILGRIPPDARP